MEACAETLWFLHTGGVSKLHILWAKTAFTLLLEGQTIKNKEITSIIYVNLYNPPNTLLKGPHTVLFFKITFGEVHILSSCSMTFTLKLSKTCGNGN
jgi:hypothetical protein